jgi:hypothetical protein
MFLKFDKDNSNSLSRDELHFAFEVCWASISYKGVM